MALSQQYIDGFCEKCAELGIGHTELAERYANEVMGLNNPNEKNARIKSQITHALQQGGQRFAQGSRDVIGKGTAAVGKGLEAVGNKAMDVSKGPGKVRNMGKKVENFGYGLRTPEVTGIKGSTIDKGRQTANTIQKYAPHIAAGGLGLGAAGAGVGVTKAIQATGEKEAADITSPEKEKSVFDILLDKAKNVKDKVTTELEPYKKPVSDMAEITKSKVKKLLDNSATK